MKKLLLSFFVFALFVPGSRAADCFQDPIYDRDWNGEVTTSMFVRDVACMEGSSIIATVPVGEVVKVIAETDGWYKVQTKGGVIGWSGQQLLTQTNKPFSGATLQEPLFDIVGHKYEDAVRYLAENGIIQGYPDGSYQPESSVNRAEFTKILVGAKYGTEASRVDQCYQDYRNEVSSCEGRGGCGQAVWNNFRSCVYVDSITTSEMMTEENEKLMSYVDCFIDVSQAEWFHQYVCYAKMNGIISGYPDGTFKPAANINLAEAAKILVNTLEVEVELSSDSSGYWYEAFIRALQNNSYIPDSFNSVSQLVNRSQMAEMVYRIMEEIKDQPSKTLVSASASLACLDSEMPASIDMDEVRAQWLNWHNQARASRGIASLSQNTGLDYSSSLWAKANKSIGTITHDRPDGQSLTDWFAEIGIIFEKKNGIVYGENLGYRTLRCNEADCTEEVLDSARTIFDAFMAEEGTNYTSHYDNIVESDFIELGLGMAYSSAEEAVYIATQYSYGVDSYPSNMCQ